MKNILLNIFVNMIFIFINILLSIYLILKVKFIFLVLTLYFAYYLTKDTRKLWKERKKLIHNAVTRCRGINSTL